MMFVWIVLTGGKEVFRIFRTEQDALRAISSIGNLPGLEYADPVWKMMPQGIHKLIDDWNGEGVIPYIWIVYKTEPLVPLAMCVSEANAKKKYNDYIKKGQSVMRKKFPVYGRKSWIFS